MLPSVIARNLGKQYRRYSPDRPLTFQEAILKGWRHVRSKERFWVLKGINITVMPGQMLGVIGKNGAGKSTLLNVLSGVLRPDEGVASVHGRIGTLLRLGGCFHPELTGRENAYASGVIGGLTRSEMNARMDEIIQFANLSEFIDSPVRTYSSGMILRLGFAAAVHSEPNVLLVDECLSVGDREFEAKCLEKIDQMREHGCAVVLVTHGLDRVIKHCDQAMWIHHGQNVAFGDCRDVVKQYESFRESVGAVPSARA